MKDCFGTSIAVDDEVAVIVPHYRFMVPGVITKVTPCGAQVCYRPFGGDKARTTFRESCQIAKKPKEEINDQN